MDVNQIRERILYLERSIYEGTPEEIGNESVLFALTDNDVNLTLHGLCEGEITIDKLEVVLSRHRLQVLMTDAEMWLNAYLRGLEMIIIGSRSKSGEETRNIYIRYQCLVDTLKSYGVVQVIDFVVDNYKQCKISILGGNSVPSHEEIRKLLRDRNLLGQELQFHEFGEDTVKKARLEHLEGDKVMLKDETGKLWLLPYQAILLESLNSTT